MKARKKFDAASRLWLDKNIGEYFLPRVIGGVCWYKERKNTKSLDCLSNLHAMLKNECEKIPDFEDLEDPLLEDDLFTILLDYLRRAYFNEERVDSAIEI